MLKDQGCCRWLILHLMLVWNVTATPKTFKVKPARPAVFSPVCVLHAPRCRRLAEAFLSCDVPQVVTCDISRRKSSEAAQSDANIDAWPSTRCFLQMPRSTVQNSATDAWAPSTQLSDYVNCEKATAKHTGISPDGVNLTDTFSSGALADQPGCSSLHHIGSAGLE